MNRDGRMGYDIVVVSGELKIADICSPPSNQDDTNTGLWPVTGRFIKRRSMVDYMEKLYYIFIKTYCMQRLIEFQEQNFN